jgi:o-succinylbenzoate synthase
MEANFIKHTLQFHSPSGTSRGILKTKDSWFLILKEDYKVSIGECSIIEGLNPEGPEDVEDKLQTVCDAINNNKTVDELIFDNAPSVRFAYEMAFQDQRTGATRELYSTNFLKGKGIPINGLIWMGDTAYMLKQIAEKISHGYDCLKLKIAAIDFESELDLLKKIRTEYSDADLEIRLDANGGFNNHEVQTRLQRLSEYNIHSIEQPIKQGQWNEMAKLIYNTPIPIALDEELIGLENLTDKQNLIETIKPNYIILKPSLLGGFEKTNEWISLANKHNIKWWVTSALESNIGLSAIAQWTASLEPTMKYQGLGTGQLYSNNIPSPLYIDKGQLFHGNTPWDLKLIGC